MRRAPFIVSIVVSLVAIAGLSGCASHVSDVAASSSGSGAASNTPSAKPVPADASCPAGVEDATAQGLKDFEGYTSVQTKAASAADTPLDAVAEHLSGALCILGFVGLHGTQGANTEHGTVAFLPVAQEGAVVSALEAAGYTNELQVYTYSLGGQITSSKIPSVTITPSNYWSVDFTPLFSQPIVVVTTDKG